MIAIRTVRRGYKGPGLHLQGDQINCKLNSYLQSAKTYFPNPRLKTKQSYTAVALSNRRYGRLILVQRTERVGKHPDAVNAGIEQTAVKSAGKETSARGASRQSDKT
ncbi:hypothetical protein EVAR_5198_1 [Eumeta japonica]|uniref:Uncharacterized protein n=1 Tax=Eumeta variegata TaxID=151549 RepID=A0A4C1V4T3_EUMVA|nr:hypothetical protein EVAR_5198_1 [Eumeta japonica]